MDRRWSRLTGGASLLGGILSVLTNVPSTWYGLEPHDSYVFSPPLSSPLWINRVLVPTLSLAAVIGLLLGVAGLVGRDWSVAGRARRWGGIGGVVAFAAVTVTAFTLLNSSQATGSATLLPLVGLAVGALGLLVLVPAMILLAYGYSKTDRPHVGYAFAGVLVTVPVLGYFGPGSTTLVASFPIGIAWGMFGVELLQHPDRLPISDQENDD